MSSNHPSVSVVNLNRLGLSDHSRDICLGLEYFPNFLHPVHYTNFQLKKIKVFEKYSILFFVSSTYTKQKYLLFLLSVTPFLIEQNCMQKKKKLQERVFSYNFAFLLLYLQMKMFHFLKAAQTSHLCKIHPRTEYTINNCIHGAARGKRHL